MRLPRDVSGEALVRALSALGYVKSRQTGSHVRLTTTEHGEHHLTVPIHAALRLGTLGGLNIDNCEIHFCPS
jgi:predicted RNA binding protein YcfA (HicA-like mRNA interferase family)